MNNFIIALNAVVPFLIYLGFGYISRERKVFDEPFIDKLNKMVFRLFFPCVTFYNIYNASWEGMPSLKLLLTTIVSLLSSIVILCFVVPVFVKKRNRQGVVVQAIFRSNVLLYGLPLTISIFGQEYSPVASIIVTTCITIYNVAAIIVLEMFNGEKKTSPKQLFINVCKNPLLQGAVLGFVCFLLHIRLPKCVASSISAFSSMTSPLALFILGAKLHFSEIGKNLKCLIITIFIKMIALPAFMIAFGYAIGLRGIELFLVMEIFATPVATSSYPMAQNMGGDGELAGQFVVLSTAISLFTLFFWIYFMKAVGLF